MPHRLKCRVVLGVYRLWKLLKGIVAPPVVGESEDQMSDGKSLAEHGGRLVLIFTELFSFFIMENFKRTQK